MVLTRGQSRMLAQKEEKHKKVENDVDHKDELSQADEIEANPRPETPVEEAALGDSDYQSLEEEVESSNNQAAEEEPGSSDDDDEESETEESDDEQENDMDEDESDEEDLEELLNNARIALSKQKQFEETKMQDDDVRQTPSIPKLNTGVNVYEQLYIKEDKGVARLVEESVALVDEDDHGALKKRQVEVLKQSKPEEKRLSRKERQEEREKTAGKGWFDMPKPELTPEMKRDLQVLKMRHVIDRKRHYKKFGKGEEPKYFQTGTIIEGATEFFSSRINRKDRKQTIVDELLADETARSYHKRKHLEAQSRGRNGRKKVKREMKRL